MSSAVKKTTVRKKTTKVVKPEIKVETKAETKDKYFEAVGRRKSAVARVRIYPNGKGILINDKTVNQYFPIKEYQDAVEIPYKLTHTEGQFKTTVKVNGGGLTGQAEAIRLGISRALTTINNEYKPTLRHHGYLTRDSRKVERKKYGLKKARRAPQWQKR